jgi:hypothetical protein
MRDALSGPAAPDACDPTNAVYHATCRAQFDYANQLAVEKMLRKCAWVQMAVPQTAWSYQASTQPERGGFKGVDKPVGALPFSDRQRVEYCSSRSKLHGEIWTFFRAGTFTTTGGSDWTSVWIPELTLPGQDGPVTLAVQAHFVGSMAVDGTLFGYPPLHQHHFHLEEYNLSSPNPHNFFHDFRGAFISHGDDQCLARYGGITCCVHPSPPGHAVFTKLPLLMNSDVNDVRAAGSPPLEWYMLAALRTLPAESETARALKSVSQLRVFARPVVDDSQLGYPATYGVSSSARSAFWSSGT